jgi:hypothetical protein
MGTLKRGSVAVFVALLAGLAPVQAQEVQEPTVTISFQRIWTGHALSTSG